MPNKIYKINGMHCASCASIIELDLEDAGITARCSYAKGILEVEKEYDKKKVVEVVKKSGYSISAD